MTRLPGVLIDSCPFWLTRISVPRGMIMVGKFAWSAAPLITLSSPELPSPRSPHERRWQRVEVAIVLRRAGPHQEGCFIVPLVIEDVNAGIARQVAAGLLESA